MAGRVALPEEQRRTLDRLKPASEELGLYLAGGTAIALHLGHRISRDLDLFTNNPEVVLERARTVLSRLSNAEVTSISDATLAMRIDTIPVDIVKYPYPLLNPPSEGPGQFPVASLEDLATMKLAAAARRGIRRDFWDLYEIFQSGAVTLASSLASYTRRFGVKESDLYHVIRALTFFDDAEADVLMPEGLTAERWATIKRWFTDAAPDVLRSVT
jgi:predicted nucleotidyltransferase component of viral defense system